MGKILITGANGQIGSELRDALRYRYGSPNVIGLDLSVPTDEEGGEAGPHVVMDARDKPGLEELVARYRIDTIFHLAGLLSATGERYPDLAWDVNLTSLKHVLEVAKAYRLKVFWPSSIAAFGPSCPKDYTPQQATLDPTTIYGVTKVAGEILCHYYFEKFGVDVRSVRYPGLISYKTPPGGGTTDFAVAMFYEALSKGTYTCFVSPETTLPMMYMADAIRATLAIMEEEPSRIKIRTSYNVAAISFSAKELAEEIAKHIPAFTCTYCPDERQQIADSWPRVIDDTEARQDWGWRHAYNLQALTQEMLTQLVACRPLSLSCSADTPPYAGRTPYHQGVS